MFANAVVPKTLSEHLLLLGGIPAERVHAQPAPGTATFDDWIAATESGNVVELVDGTLVDKTTGLYESLIAAVLIRYFGIASGNGVLGVVSGEQGFIHLACGQCRAPDVAFYRWSSLPDGKLPADRVPEITPDIAVEVLSEGNTIAEMLTKRKEYFQSGASLVWMVDPGARSIAVYTTPLHCEVFNINGTVDGGSVLPGLRIVIAELFAEVDGERRDPAF